ncbi:hypothetical protein AB1L42_23595 [Thalassoglobus sp. JC818]|uniref:hypothetical protein n=1 Tax=Thalassoglobus sp. JC818 TaxID=3232136 RepID=UPI0034584A51
MVSTFSLNEDAVDNCGLIDIEKAEVVPGILNGTFFLIVSGTKPCVNMKVELQPLVYVRCPEYWGIQVIGCVPGGICLPQTAPFVVAIPLAGVTGSKGIEVLSASSSEKFEVTGGCKG